MRLSILLTKAPGTLERLRQDPEALVFDAQFSPLRFRFSFGENPSRLRAKDLVDTPGNEAVVELVEALFPSLQENASSIEHASDRLCWRRPLLTALRYGILPGDWSHGNISQFVNATPEKIEKDFAKLIEDSKARSLTDRFVDLYENLEIGNREDLWWGLGRGLAKKDDRWQTSYCDAQSVARALADLLRLSASRSIENRQLARKVFFRAKESGEIELVSHWIRSHIFVYGLYDRRRDGGEKNFITDGETDHFAREQAEIWKAQLKAGDLLRRTWTLLPVYLMLEVGIWDQDCSAAIETVAKQSNASLDALVLMLYGGNYSTGRDTINKIWSYSELRKIGGARSSNREDPPHPTVMSALHKLHEGIA